MNIHLLPPLKHLEREKQTSFKIKQRHREIKQWKPFSVEGPINCESLWIFLFYFFLMRFFTKLQWKHSSVVEQMLDVTEMHLPKDVKVLLPGLAEMMEHVEQNMFFVTSH